MLFLSQLLNRTVYDSRNEVVGKCVDVFVDPGEGFPALVALGLQRGGQEHLISAVDLARVDRRGITLSARLRDLSLYERDGEEIGLAHQVLDRQIIDINGKRVLRVNDLQFAYASGKYHLVAVDASPAGLARRLGVDKPLGKIFKLSSPSVRGLIPWDQVDPTAIGSAGVRLKVSRQELTQLHPADLADIIEQLDVEAGDYLLSTLDTEFAADTLQEIEPERQASALVSLEPELAADILEAMEPDEAADVLGDISADRAADLLSRMDQEDAEDVRELLAYPEDSAGGIMTTEYISIPGDIDVNHTIDRLRHIGPEVPGTHYLYVTGEDETLLGVISLWDLVISPPERPISEFMVSPVIRVTPTESKKDVASLLAKYNLLAVPVTDPAGRMLGIVTVDDAIEE